MPRETKPVTTQQRAFLVKWLNMSHAQIDLLTSGSAHLIIQAQTKVWNMQDIGDEVEEERLTYELHRMIEMCFGLAMEQSGVEDSESSEELRWITSDD